jgi:hypothetical protein
MVCTVDVYVDPHPQPVHGVDIDTVTAVSEICASFLFVPEDGGRMYFRSVGITIHIYVILFNLLTTSAFQCNVRVPWSLLRVLKIVSISRKRKFVFFPHLQKNIAIPFQF